MTNRIDPTHDDDHDGGLVIDIARLVDRRSALRLMGLGLVAFAGCRTGDKVAGATAAPAARAGSDANCTATPEETGGPFPGDGSNGPNVLTQSGVVRKDIRSSFGSSKGTAGGVPLTVALTVVSLRNGCKPYKGAAVYIWHCTRDGEYSLYGQDVQNENYLRGVQVTDDTGVLTFTSIFPGCYAGRWPHIHFEVYPDLGSASGATAKLRTSQIALPKDACDTVYATPGYEVSAQNLTRTSLASDNVFSDGWAAELAKMSGDVNSALTAAFTVAV